MIFHRDVWNATQGYDERLIYWGWMEGDLALRLGKNTKSWNSVNMWVIIFISGALLNLTEYKDRNGPATSRKKE